MTGALTQPVPGSNCRRCTRSGHRSQAPGRPRTPRSGNCRRWCRRSRLRKRGRRSAVAPRTPRFPGCTRRRCTDRRRPSNRPRRRNRLRCRWRRRCTGRRRHRRGPRWPVPPRKGRRGDCRHPACTGHPVRCNQAPNRRMPRSCTGPVRCTGPHRRRSYRRSGLGFAGAADDVAHPGVAGIIQRGAVDRRATAGPAVHRSVSVQGTPSSQARSVDERLGLANARPRVADAAVALIGELGTIETAARAKSRGALIGFGAKVAVVAGSSRR